VSEFIDGLRADLVEAAAREQRVGRLGRAARPVRPRAWRPAAAVGAMALAAIIAAVAIAVVALAPPAQRAGSPHVVAILDVGGSPVDAAFGQDSLWVTGFSGTVIRIDPAGRRLVARVDVAGQPEGVAVGAGAVWVRTPNQGAGDPLGTRLVKIDPKRNRVVASAALGGGAGLAAGADTVWAPRRFTMPEGVDGLDARDLARTQRLPLANVDAVADAGTTLWVIQHDGTVAQVDTATAHVVRRWPNVAPSDAEGSPAKLAVDRDGVWVLSTANAEILRIAAGRVVLRIPVDRSVRPLLASARDGLWIASGDRLGRANHLMRIDPDTGKVTATIDIGDHRPVALVTARDTLCVVTADGKVVLVRQ
jgi:hypothetical protein